MQGGKNAGRSRGTKKQKLKCQRRKKSGGLTRAAGAGSRGKASRKQKVCDARKRKSSKATGGRKPRQITTQLDKRKKGKSVTYIREKKGLTTQPLL